MKHLAILLLILFLSPVTNAQKKYIPDEDVEFDLKDGVYIIRQISTEKQLARITKKELVTDPYHGLIGFKENNHYGLLSIYGKVVIPAIYDKIAEEDYSAFQFLGNSIGLSKGGQMIALDTLGKTVIPMGNWQGFHELDYNLMVVYQNEKVGLFKNGKQVLPCVYDAVPSYGTLSFGSEKQYDVECIQRNDSIGLIDKNGRLIVATQYEKLYRMDDAYWIASKNDTCTIYDIHGKLLLETDLMGVDYIQDDFILGHKGRNFGIINWKGDVVYPFELDVFGSKIVNNTIFANKNGNWGLIRFNDILKTELCYQSVYEPTWNTEGKCMLMKNGYFGIINQQGEMVVPFDLKMNDRYFNAYQNFYIVERDNKQGIIESNGKFKIPCQYDSLIVSDYSPIKAINNGKMGQLNSDGEVLIPLQYDEIGGGLLDRTVLVKNNNKIGVYKEGEKELIPCIYDSIYSYHNFYCVYQKGKQGLFDAEGKQLIPCVFSEVITLRDNNIIVQSNGYLEQYNIQTGVKEALTPDSICRFETTSFLNFGGQYEEAYNPLTETISVELKYGTWMFVENDTQKLISEIFYQVGQFDAQKRIVATPTGSDYFFAYNHLGQNLKPKFHLINKEYFSKIILSNEADTIRHYLMSAGLLNNVPEAQIEQYIKEHYIIQVTTDYYYDEYGNQYDAFLMRVNDKKSYFDLNTPFPEKPLYDFNYYDYYSSISVPNEAGWMWAIPKEDFYFYDGMNLNKYPMNKTVLINALGQEKDSNNYVPVQSKPFMIISTFNPINEKEPTTLMEIADTLKQFFKGATELSNEVFCKNYADSIFIYSDQNLNYTEENGEYYYYEHHVFKRKGVQLFTAAPPLNITYEFFPESFAAMKGTNGLKEPDTWVQFRHGSQRAYAFGNKQFFIYPTNMDYLPEAEQAIRVNELIQALPSTANPKIKTYLLEYKKYSELIKKGIARSDMQDDLYNMVHEAAINYEDYLIFSYQDQVGLVVENEVKIAPQYHFSMTEFDENGKSIAILLADMNGKVMSYDWNTNKTASKKDLRFLVKTGSEVILLQAKSKLMNAYPLGITDFKETQMQFSFPQINAKNIKSFFYLTNCNSDIPYSNIDGTDSVDFLPDGTMVYVYPPCDTLMYDATRTFKYDLYFSYYETLDGTLYSYDGQKVEGLTISEFARYSDLPLNDHHWRMFTIRKVEKGYELNNSSTSLVIPFKTYNALLKQTPESNFYGGVVIDGVYYSYQTLLPFPEKHDIIIRTGHDSYKVGNKKQLEKVTLGYDNQIFLREKI